MLPRSHAKCSAELGPKCDVGGLRKPRSSKQLLATSSLFRQAVLECTEFQTGQQTVTKIDIDLEYLIFAYRDEEAGNIYYLDTEYGEVRLVNRGLSALRDLTDEIEIAREKFLYVPKLTKEELLKDLQAFTATLTDEKIKGLLPLAFENPHVYSTYKAILAASPEELARLELFLKEQARQRLLVWLQANFIEPTT